MTLRHELRPAIRFSGNGRPRNRYGLPRIRRRRDRSKIALIEVALVGAALLLGVAAACWRLGS